MVLLLAAMAVVGVAATSAEQDKERAAAPPRPTAEPVDILGGAVAMNTCKARGSCASVAVGRA